MRLVQTTCYFCSCNEISASGTEKFRNRPRTSLPSSALDPRQRALDLLGAVIDHIQAFSSGGGSEIDNLATACNKCNGRKSAAPMEKWDGRPVDKPIKGKYGEPQDWDGLSMLFVMLAARNPTGLTASEKAWLKALS
jgi:HNH endonuclease